MLYHSLSFHATSKVTAMSRMVTSRRLLLLLMMSLAAGCSSNVKDGSKAKDDTENKKVGSKTDAPIVATNKKDQNQTAKDSPSVIGEWHGPKGDSGMIFNDKGDALIWGWGKEGAKIIGTYKLLDKKIIEFTSPDRTSKYTIVSLSTSQLFLTNEQGVAVEFRFMGLPQNPWVKTRLPTQTAKDSPSVIGEWHGPKGDSGMIFNDKGDVLLWGWGKEGAKVIGKYKLLDKETIEFTRPDDTSKFRIVSLSASRLSLANEKGAVVEFRFMGLPQNPWVKTRLKSTN